MRIMNTPTADKNPIASGDTKRKRHIQKNSLVKIKLVKVLLSIRIGH